MNWLFVDDSSSKCLGPATFLFLIEALLLRAGGGFGRLSFLPGTGRVPDQFLEKPQRLFFISLRTAIPLSLDDDDSRARDTPIPQLQDPFLVVVGKR